MLNPLETAETLAEAQETKKETLPLPTEKSQQAIIGIFNLPDTVLPSYQNAINKVFALRNEPITEEERKILRDPRKLAYQSRQSHVYNPKIIDTVLNEAIQAQKEFNGQFANAATKEEQKKLVDNALFLFQKSLENTETMQTVKQEVIINDKCQSDIEWATAFFGDQRLGEYHFLKQKAKQVIEELESFYSQIPSDELLLLIYDLKNSANTERALYKINRRLSKLFETRREKLQNDCINFLHYIDSTKGQIRQ